MSALVDPFVFASVLVWSLWAFVAWMVCAGVVWLMRAPARRAAAAHERLMADAAHRTHMTRMAEDYRADARRYGYQVPAWTDAWLTADDRKVAAREDRSL